MSDPSPPPYTMHFSFRTPSAVLLPPPPPRAFSAHDTFGTRSGRPCGRLLRPAAAVYSYSSSASSNAQTAGEGDSSSDDDESVQNLHTKRRRIYDPRAELTHSFEFNSYIRRDYLCT
jgi:hypothetical protein